MLEALDSPRNGVEHVLSRLVNPQCKTATSCQTSCGGISVWVEVAVHKSIYESTFEATHENHAVGERLRMGRVHTSARYLSASAVGVAVFSPFQYGSGLRLR